VNTVAPKIESVILDYAGVMTVPISQARRLAKEADVDRVALRSVMGDIMGNPDPDSVWSKLERGEMTIDAFIDMYEDRVRGIRVAFHPDSEHLFISNLEVRPDMVARVRAWRSRGIPVALCTNNIAEWRPTWSSKLGGAENLFDVVVDSSAVGMRKPEARIYEHTLALLGASAATTLFVDDLLVNVEGARSVGLHGIHATDDDTHLSAIDTLVGAPV
jgi:putative hydrolase of the HAD superfamily